MQRCGYVTLAGRPNVGKSSLLNRLVGQKLAITSHKPQTTRHRILGIKTSDAGQILFVDTPGLHQRGSQAMNRYLNRTAESAMQEVELVVLVCEAGRWTDEDAEVLARLSRQQVPVLAAVNKIDRVRPRDRLLPYLAALGERADFAAVVPVAARTGENCEVLEQQILAQLPAGEPIYPEDQLSDRPERFFAAELLREQLIRRYHQELPYALTVEIEAFTELPGRVNIGAVIWVERESQRRILIGRKGEALKATASAARQEMIRFFERRVGLDVWIKVRDSWSSDETSLAHLGYTD